MTQRIVRSVKLEITGDKWLGSEGCSIISRWRGERFLMISESNWKHMSRNEDRQMDRYFNNCERKIREIKYQGKTKKKTDGWECVPQGVTLPMVCPKIGLTSSSFPHSGSHLLCERSDGHRPPNSTHWCTCSVSEREQSRGWIYGTIQSRVEQSRADDKLAEECMRL